MKEEDFVKILIIFCFYSFSCIVFRKNKTFKKERRSLKKDLKSCLIFLKARIKIKNDHTQEHLKF